MGKVRTSSKTSRQGSRGKKESNGEGQRIGRSDYKKI